MKMYKFSEASVEYAKALNVLGFDVVHVIKPQVVSGIGGLSPIRRVLAETCGRKCELPTGWFIEIPDNEMMSVKYIIHSEEINYVLGMTPFNMEFDEDDDE